MDSRICVLELQLSERSALAAPSESSQSRIHELEVLCKSLKEDLAAGAKDVSEARALWTKRACAEVEKERRD